MAGILEYSPTPASNTSVNGIGIAGSNSVKNGDDALRQIMADMAAAMTRVVDKAAGTHTATKADHAQMWRATGAVTLNLSAAATLTSGWALWIKANGGAVTVDPSGAEQINGAATLALVDGASAFIVCTGTAFQAIVMGDVTLTGTQTLTNKTLTSPTINGAMSTSGGVLVGAATGGDPGAGKINAKGYQLDGVSAVPGDWYAVPYAATITLNHGVNGCHQRITATGNPTIAAPTSPQLNFPLVISFKQDGVGNRIPAWDAAFDFGDYGTPVGSTGANQEDKYVFDCHSVAPVKYVFNGLRRRVD